MKHIRKREVILELVDEVNKIQSEVPKQNWDSVIYKKVRFVNLIEKPKYYFDCFIKQDKNTMQWNLVLVPDADDSIIIPINL